MDFFTWFDFHHFAGLKWRGSKYEVISEKVGYFDDIEGHYVDE